jgi:hypothetical protein
MNGYTLANQFRKLRASFTFSAIEADLFYELVALCNERNWPTEFQYPNHLLCATFGNLAESTLIRARNRLKQAGLLEFTSGHKRSPTVYRFLDPDAPEIPLHSASTNASKSASRSESKSASRSDSCIYKEKTKRKTNPPADAAELEIPFADFWQAYGKKEDKHKCQQRWNTLTAPERQAALAHVPGYVAATPEKRYRKNPLTYLNGKCWQDEETPADRTPALRPAPTPPASFDPDALFGYTQTAAEGLAQTRNSPEYQQYLAELAQEQQIPPSPAVDAALAHAA